MKFGQHHSRFGQHDFGQHDSRATWPVTIWWSGPRSHSDRSGAHFAEVPKLFGRIMAALSQRERIEAQNFAVILILVPFTTYEKTSFTEQAGRIFMNGFSDSRETGACWTVIPRHPKSYSNLWQARQYCYVMASIESTLSFYVTSRRPCCCFETKQFPEKRDPGTRLALKRYFSMQGIEL